MPMGSTLGLFKALMTDCKLQGFTASVNEWEESTGVEMLKGSF